MKRGKDSSNKAQSKIISLKIIFVLPRGQWSKPPHLNTQLQYDSEFLGRSDLVKLMEMSSEQLWTKSGAELQLVVAVEYLFYKEHFLN